MFGLLWSLFALLYKIIKIHFKVIYIKLSQFKGVDNQAPKTLEAIKNDKCKWFYRSSTDDFEK